MNKGKENIFNNSKVIVMSYYLLSLLAKESRLVLLQLSIVSIAIKTLSYISLLCMVIAFINNSHKRNSRDFTRNLKVFYPIIVLYIICEIFAVVFNSKYGLLYGSRSFFHSLSILVKYSIMLPVILMMYALRREKVLETIADALIINQVIIIISNLVGYGVVRTFKDMFSLFISFSSTAESVFEVDGPTYCCGLILIFYVFNNKYKIAKWKFGFLLFALFVGSKRIAIFSFFLTVVLKFVIRKHEINKKTINRISLLIGGVILLYISILYNGKFFEIMEQIGVGLSGRSLLYMYFINQTTFSVDHLPWGMGTIEMVFLNTSYRKIANSYVAIALHNDILRLYIELGFVGFVAWLIIMTNHFPRMYLKYKGSAGVKEYYCCLSFCLVIYLVSNAYFYSPLFMLLLLVPLSTESVNNRLTLKNIIKFDYNY